MELLQHHHLKQQGINHKMDTMYVPHIIVGAGPAGLQMAYYLQRAGEDYIILERADHVSSFFSVFPRKRRLISVNKKNCGINATSEFKMRFDWNSLLNEDDDDAFRCTQYSNEYFPHTHELQTYMRAFADKYGITSHIHFGQSVANISKNEQQFIITTTKCKYTCDKLFIGTGNTPKPIPSYLTDLSNDIGATLYSYENVPLDSSLFENKNVCVVGTGNAAFEIAEFMNQYAASVALFGPAKVAWRQHYPGMLRSNNMSMLDTIYLKLNNTWYIPHTNHHKLHTQTHIYLHNQMIKWADQTKVDAIIYCGGFQFNTDIFDESYKPILLDNGFPMLTSSFESTSSPGMYFIGALTQGYDFKKGSSAFIHGFRYNIRYLARTLGLLSFAPKIVTDDATLLLNHMLTRINNSSCLSLRYEYFADCCVWQTDGTIAYYEDVPINFAATRDFNRTWTIRLGFSRDFDWDLHQREYVLPQHGHLCAFLHPIIEYIDNGELYEFHIVESPTAQFVNEDAHLLPLSMYWEFAVKNGGVNDTAGLKLAIENIRIRGMYERYPRIIELLEESNDELCAGCIKDATIHHDTTD